MGRTKRSVGVALALVAMLVIASCGSSDDGDSASTSTSTSTKPDSKKPAYAATLQQQIPELMKQNAIPGAAILIRVGRQGDWTAQFGTRAIGTDEPISLDDYWRIASNTKTMTATVVLQLVQEGKLGARRPALEVRRGLPER